MRTPTCEPELGDAAATANLQIALVDSEERGQTRAREVPDRATRCMRVLTDRLEGIDAELPLEEPCSSRSCGTGPPRRIAGLRSPATAA